MHDRTRRSKSALQGHNEIELLRVPKARANVEQLVAAAHEMATAGSLR